MSYVALQRLIPPSLVEQKAGMAAHSNRALALMLPLMLPERDTTEFVGALEAQAELYEALAAGEHAARREIEQAVRSAPPVVLGMPWHASFSYGQQEPPNTAFVTVAIEVRPDRPSPIVVGEERWRVSVRRGHDGVEGTGEELGELVGEMVEAVVGESELKPRRGDDS